jgi:hypothetical protein
MADFTIRFLNVIASDLLGTAQMRVCVSAEAAKDSWHGLKAGTLQASGVTFLSK